MEKKKKKKVKLTDDMLHNMALRMMEIEEKQIDEEMKNAEPHVFSAEFERKMQELMRVATPAELAAKRRKKRMQKIQVAAAAIVTVVMVAGLMFQGNKNVAASNMSVWIKQWFEKSFLIEEGLNVRQDEGVLFKAEQIGYIPKGFELVAQEVEFAKVYYKYGDSSGKFIALMVVKNKTSLSIDNEKIGQDAYLNNAGLEYHFIVTVDSKNNGLYWFDKMGHAYVLSGDVTQDELINIMNSINYE